MAQTRRLTARRGAHQVFENMSLSAAMTVLAALLADDVTAHALDTHATGRHA